MERTDHGVVVHWSRRGSAGWTAVAMGILIWDLAAPEGETLSEAFRRGATTPGGKVAVAATCGLIVGHLYEVIPKKCDPLHGIRIARDYIHHRKLEACGIIPEP